MKTQLRALVRNLVDQGIDNLRAQGTLPADLAVPEFVVERPKDRSHGDFSCNVAMLLARPAAAMTPAAWRVVRRDRGVFMRNSLQKVR